MVLECEWRPSQIGPHQVTYDAAALLIHNGQLEAVDWYIITALDTIWCSQSPSCCSTADTFTKS
eukprot:scaffold28001_cov106-Skeletonema_marinoi.AAC.2